VNPRKDSRARIGLDGSRDFALGCSPGRSKPRSVGVPARGTVAAKGLRHSTERRDVVTSSAGQMRDEKLLVLCLSLVIVVMDNTILNVALPTLTRDLRVTGSELQWIVDAYLLAFAGLVLTMGALGDRFGRKLTSTRALSASGPPP
jgi:hypothetical protein